MSNKKISDPSLFFIASFLCMISGISCESSRKKTTCSDYRQGKFKYNYKYGNIVRPITFKREDSIQIETDDYSQYTTTFSVKWINECRYELRFVSTTLTLPDSVTQQLKNNPLTTDITSGTDEFYTFRVERIENKEIVEDTIWRQ